MLWIRVRVKKIDIQGSNQYRWITTMRWSRNESGKFILSVKKVVSFSSLIHGIDLDYEYICFDPRSFTSDWHGGLRCCKDQGFGDKHLIKGGGRKKRPEYLEPY